MKSRKKSEVEKTKKRLLDFSLNTDIYQQSLYSERKAEVQALLVELENFSETQSNSTDTNGLSLPVKIAIGGVVLALVALAGVFWVKRRKRLLLRKTQRRN